MKKDKLYTVNKWNQPAFMREGNVFDGFGNSLLNNPNPFGVYIASPTARQYIDWSNPFQKAAAIGTSAGLVNGFSSMAPAFTLNNDKINQRLGALGANATNSLNSLNSGTTTAQPTKGSALIGILGAVGGTAGKLLGNAIADGYSTGGVGEGVADIGNMIGGAMQAIPGVGALAGTAVQFASGLVGGAINRGWGVKENKENIEAIKQNTAAARSTGNVMAGASTNEDVLNSAGTMTASSGFSAGDLYKNGWWTNKGTKKGNELIRKENAALAFQNHGLVTGANNADNNMDSDIMRNFAAFGGPIPIGRIIEPDSDNMGAIEYGFMSDWIESRKNREKNKGNDFVGKPQNTLLALGGDLQVHGADWSDGLVTIGAGGTHEENPNDGVQMGVDSQNIPNLVEEGEVIYNDYVYSNRIKCDETTKKKFHISKKREITYADLAKKLEKEIAERPNDPISKRGFEAQMSDLADEQERQKAEMEADRARKAFEALSPEEQVAVMQQAEQQEQMTQEADMQEQAMAEQAALEQQAAAQQQPTPEEVAMAEQQIADGSEAAIGQEPQVMAACGGKINRFDFGGKLINALGFHTKNEYIDWLKENGIEFSPEKESITYGEEGANYNKWMSAIANKNPALAHAMANNYDFGAYSPENINKATIQSISRGNWKATNGKGWMPKDWATRKDWRKDGTNDLAFIQAIEKLTDEEVSNLTTEQLAELMRNTDAYKNTSKWLENSDNALMYLNTLLNDPDTPDVAKKHALQYVKDGKWKDGYKYNYNDVFGKVRSTNPGTYWHTAMEANRGNEANNFVINEDGSIEPILGNVPTDWTSAGNYSWADENSDYTYNYYKRPAAATKPEAAKTPEEKEAEEEKGVAPKHRLEWLRYAGLFGPAVGLGMQLAGVGRPDYSGLDAALERYDRAGTKLADYKTIGNYLAYRPMDIWAEQNRLNANSRGTERAILNSGANQGAKMAGLLAAGYNDQIASGELYRKALEYNDAKRQQVATFNRGTDQFNAEAYNRAALANATALNSDRSARAQLATNIAGQKLAGDAGWYNSLYGNVGGIFKGISDLGRENADRNQIARLVVSGAIPGVNPDNAIFSGYAKYAAKGGKLKKNKRRGLTF